MNQLLQGMESRKKIACLLAQTKIVDGPKVDAIYFHLVEGCAQSRAAIMFQVKQSKLSEALEKLNAVAEHNERYHELKVHEPENDTTRTARLRAALDNYARERKDCNCQERGCDQCLEPAIEDINNLFEGVPA